MKGSEFIATLDEQPTAAREEAIIQAVRDQLYLPIQWCGIKSVSGAHFCILYVASDALRIGEPDDFVRINVTHTGAQTIADIMGYALPTSKIADLLHEQAAVVVSPCTQSPDSKMAYTSRMLKHSQAVTTKIAGKEGLASTVGKDWILSNKLVGKPDLGVNYGWHDKSAPYTSQGGLKMWQTTGTAHNRFHVDYSQVLRLVHRWLLVDGKDMLLENVLTDPELAPMLSYEGVLQVVRHPGVELVGDGSPAVMVCGG